MSAALQPLRMTLEAFFDWREGVDGEWEYDGFGPVAMSGALAAHTRITRILNALLWVGLRGTRCKSFGSDLGVETDRAYRLPDAVASCSRTDDRDRSVHKPVTVFEVLSPNTGLTDANAKNREYRGIRSVRRCVMFDQDRMAATVFVRSGADRVGRIIEDADTMLEMPEIGIGLRLGNVYEGVATEPA